MEPPARGRCRGRVWRFQIGGLAGFSALALVALMPTSAPRALDLAPQPQRAQLGLISNRTGTSLVRLDPISLRRSGRVLRLNGLAGAWALAPDARLLAFAFRPHLNSSADTLRFYGVAGPSKAGRGVPLGGPALALIWMRPDRILAYVNDCCPNPNGAASILAVDPRSRRTVARTPIEGSVLQIARGPDSLVLLAGETGRIGPSRLVVVDADGASRSVSLDRINAGLTWPEGLDDPVGTRVIPGLEVDTTRNRAFVIAPDGVVAEVELDSLVVSYHQLVESRSSLDRIADWLSPAAEAKGINGPSLTARWVGDGLIGVAGSHETTVHEGERLRITSHPLGLRIVDTRDWSMQMLDAGADAFTVSDGLLLATGASWSSEPRSESGMGVAVYDQDRTRRFQLLAGRQAWIGFVYRGRAYVSVSGQSALQVVDLASGRIVGTRRADAPWPLLGESSLFH
jgi:hypothetical protein